MSNSARIHWGEEDSTFIAVAHELPGYLADDRNTQEALGN